MIKASIIITTYEKNKLLPNVFYSISRQVTNFDFEVCVLDDYSSKDPKPLFDRYLQVKNKKYKRILNHLGNRAHVHSDHFPTMPWFKSAHSMSLDMVSPESDVVIDQSADVIWASDFLLQDLVDSMKEKEVVIPRVKNMDFPEDLWAMNWEEIISYLVNHEEVGPNSVYAGDYQGSRAPRVGMLNAFYKKDLLGELNFLGCGADEETGGLLTNLGYKWIYRDDLIGIHQRHEAIPTVVVLHEAQLYNWDKSCPREEKYE